MADLLSTFKTIFKKSLTALRIDPKAKSFDHCFWAHPDMEKINKLNWVSWAFDNQEFCEKAIKEVFGEVFPDKECTVIFGSTGGGMRDYVHIFAKVITLDEILNWSTQLAAREQFLKSMELFIQILLEEIRDKKMKKIFQITLSATDPVAENRKIEDMHFVEWFLFKIMENGPEGNALTYVVMFRIGKEFPDMSYTALSFSAEKQTITIDFNLIVPG